MTPLAPFDILTAESPALLLEQLAAALAHTARSDGWCLVTPRQFLRSDLVTQVLAQAPVRGWICPRVLTVQELIQHFHRTSQDDVRALTRLQVRQVITAILLELDAESPGQYFPGQIVQGRVSDATLRALTRLFAELEPTGLDADGLLQTLAPGDEPQAVSARARDIATVYTRYQARLSEHGFVGPMGRALAAAQQAAILPPPPGLSSFLFVGLDGMHGHDIALVLLAALRRNPAVAQIRAAFVLPEEQTTSAWSQHGNEALVEIGRTADRHIVLTAAEGTPSRVPADLDALGRDPFAYRLAPTPATGAVRGIRVPDMETELQWMATDLKRTLVADPSLRAEECAVIVRDLQARSQDVERALTAVGIPMVSTRETPCAEIPAVRALLQCLRVAARGWAVRDVVAVAESPYLPLACNPTLLHRLGTLGPEPVDAADWRARIVRAAEGDPLEGAAAIETRLGRTPLLSPTLTTDAQALLPAFDRLVALLTDVAPAAPAAAACWVDRFVTLMDRCNLYSQILAPTDRVARLPRAQMARLDVDGVNTLYLAMVDWLRGREVAGLATVPLDVGTWLAEVEAMASLTTMRTSTFYRSAVHVVDPAQAALRQWRRVWILGLADGQFPRDIQDDEHGLSEAERRALALPTTDERAARERLYFQLAVATAQEGLTLVTPAADARGRALVASPFLLGLPLRLAGFTLRTVTALQMVPDGTADLCTATDLDLYAIRAMRRTLSGTTTPAAASAALTTLVTDEPVVGTWLAQPAAADRLAQWRRERLRADSDLRLRLQPEQVRQDPDRTAIALLHPEEVPAVMRDVATAFTPSELQVYDGCHFRWFASRLLGLRPSGDQDEDHDEAAAFGTLQHAILERLYQACEQAGRLPPQAPADIDWAVDQVDVIAPALVQSHRASAHPALWAQDLAFVRDVLRAFVRRDLTAWWDAASGAPTTRPRTELVSLEVQTGSEGRPVEFTVNGVTYRLRGQLDRVEVLRDPRFPPQSQDQLLIRDYKSTRRATYTSTQRRKWLNGESLQVPLYAAMAQVFFERPVFSIGILATSQGTDPAPLAREEVTLAPDESLRLYPCSDRQAADGDALATAIEAATARAAEIVGAIRAGDYAAQPGRSCYGCPLATVCRASMTRDPSSQRRRAPMPLVVDQPVGGP